jgi:transposase
MGAGEEVVPASEYRALQHQVRELQRLLGKKTLKNEILREALDLVRPKKPTAALALARAGRHAGKTISDALGVARSNLPCKGRRIGPSSGGLVPHSPRQSLSARSRR